VINRVGYSSALNTRYRVGFFWSERSSRLDWGTIHSSGCVVFEFLEHTKKKSAGEAMSRLWARFAGLFSSKSFIGVDKTGNKYFSRMEEIDGLGEYCSSNLFFP